MTTVSTIARALQGDAAALAEFDDEMRGRIERTRDRLARMPAEVAPKVVASPPNLREYVIRHALELALIELYAPGPEIDV